MPELPEVETVRLGLIHQLKLPKKLLKLELYRADLRNSFPVDVLKTYEGLTLESITRRSKYLLFWFERKGILSHLGMTGHWRIETQKFQRQTHDHIVLVLEGEIRLVYHDPRRFGFFDAFQKIEEHPLLRKLGPEPLDVQFTGSNLWSSLRNRQGPIKNLLMNQAIVAGVGNIYASEVLFKSGIKPRRRASSLSRAECERLVIELKEILQESIRLGGSSFDDFRHVSGEKGDFQNHFLVYGQEAKPCRVCGHQISKKNLAGRSTFWCRNCQR